MSDFSPMHESPGVRNNYLRRTFSNFRFLLASASRLGVDNCSTVDTHDNAILPPHSPPRHDTRCDGVGLRGLVPDLNAGAGRWKIMHSPIRRWPSSRTGRCL